MAGAGTRGYLAPEQALGQRLGPATDVWGIGGLLYESIVGEPAVPHEGGTSTGTGQRPSHLIAFRPHSRPAAGFRPTWPR